MTGWGSGPLKATAGHDINYLALSGALWYCGMPDEEPFPPPTLIGDVGGGALYLTVGLLAGVTHARSTGEGQVVDAAIVDGAASMSNILMSVRASGGLAQERAPVASMGRTGIPVIDVLMAAMSPLAQSKENSMGNS